MGCLLSARQGSVVGRHPLSFYPHFQQEILQTGPGVSSGRGTGTSARPRTKEGSSTYQGLVESFGVPELLKSNSKISVVSLEAGSNRHCFSASRAALTRKGLPPTTLVLTTRPSTEIVASSFTRPEMFISFAVAGYTGSIFVRTLRLL